MKEFKLKLAHVETQIMVHIIIQFACIYDKLTCVDCWMSRYSDVTQMSRDTWHRSSQCQCWAHPTSPPPQPSPDSNHFLMMIPDHWVATLHLQIKPNILWTRPLFPVKTWATIKIKWIQLSVLNKSINHASCIHLFSAEIGRGYWEHFVGPVIHFVQDAFVMIPNGYTYCSSSCVLLEALTQ